MIKKSAITTLGFAFLAAFAITSARAESIEMLSDGKYLFCSELPSNRDGNQWMRGMCFLFRKQGDRIAGNFFIPYSEEGICIIGNLDKNIARGEAMGYSGSDSPDTILAPDSQGPTPVNWDVRGYLQVSGGTVSQITESVLYEYSGWVHYRRAVLNINGFHRYNESIVSIPTSCELKQ